MSQIEVGEVIAERLLKGVENGLEIEVKVQIGKPVTHVAGDWICPYRIAFPNESRTFYAAGIDSIQALCLAMFAIGSELKSHHKVLGLSWLNSASLGFPIETPDWVSAR